MLDSILFQFSLLSVVLILLFSLSVGAQIKPISLPDKWEVWHDNIPVSGEIRVGVIDDYTTQLIDDKFFYVQLPTHEEKRLCVTMSSKDGRYRGELSFDIKDLPAGKYEFEWPTSYESKLKKLTAREVTLLCGLANSCEEDPSSFTYASWHEETTSDSLFIFLHSERTPTIEIQNESGGLASTWPCHKLKGRGVAFNCICAVPKKAVAPNLKAMVLVKRRRLGTLTQKRYPLPLKP